MTKAVQNMESCHLYQDTTHHSTQTLNVQWMCSTLNWNLHKYLTYIWSDRSLVCQSMCQCLLYHDLLLLWFITWFDSILFAATNCHIATVSSLALIYSRFVLFGWLNNGAILTTDCTKQACKQALKWADNDACRYTLAQWEYSVRPNEFQLILLVTFYSDCKFDLDKFLVVKFHFTEHFFVAFVEIPVSIIWQFAFVKIIIN